MLQSSEVDTLKATKGRCKDARFACAASSG
jgi:hypothetical protein